MGVTIRSVSVQCGSHPGKSPAFDEAARNLGRALAQSGIRVIFGGVRTGLMGSLADSVMEHGGRIIGVLPRFLLDEGIAHDGLTELKIVASMAARKDVMLELADATIVLPGGVGTQDEFWEVLASAQLGFHAKPCALLNTDGYYDSLLAFIDRAVAEGFMPAAERNNIMVARVPEDLIAQLSERAMPGERGGKMDNNTTNDQMNRLRSGYRPTEAEALAWNVAENIHRLRSGITAADLRWIFPPIEEDEGPCASFFTALLQPLTTEAEVRSFLARRFETAGPYLKAQLLWRLLDDAALPAATHESLFSFVLSDWDFFQNSCVSYLGSASEIIEAALGRIADCPVGKRGIYLCCLPKYADDQRAVKGILTIAVSSTDAFTGKVARTLMERFFNEKRSL